MNKRIKKKVFQQGDKVLVYNSKLGKFPGKLKLQYSGPFLIDQDLGQGLFQLKDLTGQLLLKPINGFRLKKFREGIPTSEGSNVDISRILVGVNFMMLCLNLCDLTQNFSNCEDTMGLALISRKRVRQITGFAILACANFSNAWFNCEFKISVLSMHNQESFYPEGRVPLVGAPSNSAC